MSDPAHGSIHTFAVWEDQADGRPMLVGPWTAGTFPAEMTVGGEACPVGIFVVEGNSHNTDPRQTLCLVLHDTPNGSRFITVPFGDIAGGYGPVGAAHWLLHRDYPWQDRMLRVIAASGGRLCRIYTWLFLVERQYRWEQPDPTKPGRLVPV